MISQVVVLCGGRGKRLKPLTDKVPKPMININGAPFLWYLLKQFSDHGIKNFLLLTGYKHKIIKNFFLNGSKWNWKINYCRGPNYWNTNKRIYEAKKYINNYFFLLYSDNFSSIQINKIINLHSKNKQTITLSLVKKKGGNINLDTSFKLLNYDKKRSLRKFNHVEIGYMAITKKKLFNYLNNSNTEFSNVFNNLIKKNDIGYYLQNDKYYSISDIKRLEITKKFLTPKKIILLDRDGILNKKMKKGTYVSSWNKFLLIEQNLKGLRLLSKLDYKFIIITNQAGVGRKKFLYKKLEFIHKKMNSILKKKGINILDIYICPHHWEKQCSCRKPKPKMFYQASHKYKFRLDKVLYIGDDLRDCQAAFNSGCKSILISNKVPDLYDNSIKTLGIFRNILLASKTIDDYYQNENKLL